MGEASYFAAALGSVRSEPLQEFHVAQIKGYVEDNVKNATTKCSVPVR